MGAGRNAGTAVNALGLIKYNKLFTLQSRNRAGFYTANTYLATRTAGASAIFPAAFLIINLDNHPT
jgi:hypothetical protein